MPIVFGLATEQVVLVLYTVGVRGRSALSTVRAPVGRIFPLKFFVSTPTFEIALQSILGKGMILSISVGKLAKRVLLVLVGALLLAYIGDSLWFSVRMIHPKPTDPLESFTGPRVLAIPQKGNKISYEIDQRQPEQTVTCAHSWFRHGGYRPCWYVKPRLNQPIPM